MDRKPETCILLLVMCAIVLWVSAHFFGYLLFDPLITQALQKKEGLVFVLTMQWVSFLGETWIEAILGGTVMVVFLVRRLFPEAVFVLATASSVGLTSVLKVIMGRPWPPAFFQNPADFFLSVDQFSFPSGHVFFYVVFFGFVAFLAWSFLNRRARWLVVVICASLIVLIGPSWVYLGAHWTSDVIGGYVLGTLWLYAIILGYLLLVQRYRMKGNVIMETDRVK